MARISLGDLADYNSCVAAGGYTADAAAVCFQQNVVAASPVPVAQSNPCPGGQVWNGSACVPNVFVPAAPVAPAVETCPAGYHSNLTGLGALAACIANAGVTTNSTAAYNADYAVVVAAIPAGDSVDDPTIVLNDIYAAGYTPGQVTPAIAAQFLQGAGSTSSLSTLLANPVVLAALAIGAYLVSKN